MLSLVFTSSLDTLTWHFASKAAANSLLSLTVAERRVEPSHFDASVRSLSALATR